VDEDSFVFCAAEVFRYLRDMSVGVTNTFSPSLLESTTSVNSKTLRNRDKVFYGAPPITAKSKGGVSLGGGGGGAGGTPNLIHPGAILCMIDLLPSVKYPEEGEISSGGVPGGVDDVFEASGSEDIDQGVSRDSTPSFLSSPARGRLKEDAEAGLATPPTDHTHTENLNLPSSARSKSVSPESDSFYDARVDNSGPGSPGKVELEADGSKEAVELEKSSALKEREDMGVASRVDAVRSQEDVGGEDSDEAKIEKELTRKVHACTHTHTHTHTHARMHVHTCQIVLLGPLKMWGIEIENE